MKDRELIDSLSTISLHAYGSARQRAGLSHIKDSYLATSKETSTKPFRANLSQFTASLTSPDPPNSASWEDLLGLVPLFTRRTQMYLSLREGKVSPHCGGWAGPKRGWNGAVFSTVLRVRRQVKWRETRESQVRLKAYCFFSCRYRSA